MFKTRVFIPEVVLFAVLILATHAEAAWDANASNPKPDASDLLLPMPCGGHMAFARVEVPEDQGGDRRVPMGGGGYDDFKEGAYSTWLAGQFEDSKLPGSRHVYIGKYEVSQLQWDAMSGECPELRGSDNAHASSNQRKPVTNITWSQVMAFAENYSVWLNKEHVGDLPKGPGTIAYVRLPTEVEWEYATRGGAKVWEHEFIQSTFPFKGKAMNQFVQYNSSDSAAGKLQPIGVLEPNPLGLYDTLGNAAEFTLGPFFSTKRGRLYGQPGAHTIRGGSFLTPGEQIRSAHREELPYFDNTGQLMRRRDIGFRLVIAQQTIPEERKAVDQFKKRMRASGQQDRELGDLYAELSYFIEDDSLREKLDAFNRKVTDTRRLADEQRARNGRMLMKLGGWTGYQLTRAEKTVQAKEKSYEMFQDCYRKRDSMPESAVKKCVKGMTLSQKVVDKARARFDHILAFYQDSVLSFSEDFSKSEALAHYRSLEAEWHDSNLKPTLTATCRFLNHADQMRQKQFPPEKMRASILQGLSDDCTLN